MKFNFQGLEMDGVHVVVFLYCFVTNIVKLWESSQYPSPHRSSDLHAPFRLARLHLPEYDPIEF